MIKFKSIFNHLRNCSSQSEKSENQWENRNILIGENNLRISKEREKCGLWKWKVSTVDIWIKKSGLKFIHSKVFRSGLIFYSGFLWEQDSTIEPYSLLKPTKVGFIFIRPNSWSQSEDLAAVKLSSELGRRLGLKVGFKELRLEPNCF